ncbi:MAG: Nif3-like dinuclear metal center hexameric protein [Deltaproteobacteria bacterium]|nr:Nif3-like dinuclear metal center hexameric protein [Deltaproteobacteria bacterium]
MTLFNSIHVFLDEYLNIAKIADDINAQNGLQLDARSIPASQVNIIACGVDASEDTIDAAIAAKAELLIVHHGLLWGGNRPLTGAHARKIAKCFKHELSVYAAHLPLDIHCEVGNNIEILRVLGLQAEKSFGCYHDIDLGYTAICDLSIDELCQRINLQIGEYRLFGRGPYRIKRLAVISGGAGSYISAAAQAGLDALIVGEAPHYTAIEADEQNIHLIVAGHYRTEVFGVRALGAKLAQQFGINHIFVGNDTGL